MSPCSICGQTIFNTEVSIELVRWYCAASSRWLFPMLSILHGWVCKDLVSLTVIRGLWRENAEIFSFPCESSQVGENSPAVWCGGGSLNFRDVFVSEICPTLFIDRWHGWQWSTVICGQSLIWWIQPACFFGWTMQKLECYPFDIIQCWVHHLIK